MMYQFIKFLKKYPRIKKSGSKHTDIGYIRTRGTNR